VLGEMVNGESNEHKAEEIRSKKGPVLAVGPCVADPGSGGCARLRGKSISSGDWVAYGP